MRIQFCSTKGLLRWARSQPLTRLNVPLYLGQAKKHLHLTNAEIASALGVPQRVIRLWITKKRRPTDQQIHALHQWLRLVARQKSQS